MPQTQGIGKQTGLAEAVKDLCFPAVNVLRGIELDLQEHPGCPYREMAKKAVGNLMKLISLAAAETAIKRCPDTGHPQSIKDCPCRKWREECG